MRGLAIQRLTPVPTNDNARERRIALVMELAERFIYDLGILLAGGADDFAAYVAPDALAALRTAVHPFLAGDASLRPDFGEHAQLTIDGDLADVEGLVTVHVDFENRSSLLHADGMVVAVPRRWLRLTLRTDAAVQTVLTQRLDAR